MFALSTSHQIPTDKIDKFIREVESRKSRVEQMAGYVDGYWMVDRKSGKILTVVLFDSEQSLRNAEDMARSTRSEIMGAVGATTPPAFQTYEVGVEISGRVRKAA